MAAVGVALSAVLVALTNATPITADVPWPTPEPGPESPVPKIIDSNIKPVVVPAVAGAISWVILPLVMTVPRFPPVPSSSFQAPDRVSLTIDAGSIDTTIQLVYEPILLPDAPRPIAGQEVRKAFDLRTFDHEADPVTVNLRRPWVLEIPARVLTKSFEKPERLLVARYDKDKGWMPLVTSYHRDRELLEVRILKVGLFAVLAESGAILGKIGSDGAST